MKRHLLNNFIDILNQSYNINTKTGDSFWNLRLDVIINNKNYSLMPVTSSDEILKFGNQLSNHSRDMFCPYPWGDPNKAESDINELIKNHNNKKDLAYLLFDRTTPIAFFFLWNLQEKNGLIVPELGEGIIDRYHRKGLGKFALHLLTNIGEFLNVDALELTTDLRNYPAKNLYVSKGFEELGRINNPLEINQTKSPEELKKASKIREEYHMARIFKNRNKVIHYLEQKRNTQKTYLVSN